YPETFELIEAIQKQKISVAKFKDPKIRLKARTGKKEYVQNVKSIKKQIVEGDFYELNYCCEFYADDTSINPVEVFTRLNRKAVAPFTCFLKRHEKFLLCSSPERFLKKEGEKLTAQPMKGTIKKSNKPEV